MTASHGDIVQRLHAEQPPTSGDLASCLAFELRVLAALPPAERWGLLASGGENILPYNGVMVKVGRVCDPSGQLYKLLTDIPTTNAPQWADDGTVDPSRYVAFASAPPVPIPVPVPASEVTARFDRIDLALAQIVASLAALQAQQAKGLTGGADIRFIGTAPITLRIP